MGQKTLWKVRHDKLTLKEPTCSLGHTLLWEHESMGVPKAQMFWEAGSLRRCCRTGIRKVKKR